MKRYLYLIIIISASVTAFYCNSSESKKTEIVTRSRDKAINSFFPLTEGNYWLYTNEDASDETELFNVKVKEGNTKGEETSFKMSSFPYLTKENTEQALTQKTNGEINISGYLGSNGTIVPAPDNFKKGYEWQFGVFKGYINSENESIKTNAGSFDNCFFILMTDGFTFSFEMWYKKEVGIVKWGANRTNPPTLKPVYYILKEYKVK